MDYFENKILGLEIMTKKIINSLEELKLEIFQKKKEEEEKKKEEEKSLSKLRGRLCIFWDQEENGKPKGTMIRVFSAARIKYPEGAFRYYAGDIYSGQEVGHGWKHFKVINQKDIIEYSDETIGMFKQN